MLISVFLRLSAVWDERDATYINIDITVFLRLSVVWDERDASFTYHISFLKIP